MVLVTNESKFGSRPSSELNERIIDAMLSLNRTGLAASDSRSLIQGVRAAIRHLIDIEKVGISLWVDDGQYLQQMPGSFDASEEIVASSQIQGMDSRSSAGRVMSDGRLWFTNDAVNHIPAFQDWVRGFEITHLLTAPLSELGRRFGVVQLANVPGGFTPEDARVISRLLPFIASAVANLERRIALERREGLATVNAEVAGAVISGKSLQQLAEGPLRKFCERAQISVLAVHFDGEPTPRVLVDHTPAPSKLRAILLEEASDARLAVRTRRILPVGVGDGGATFAHVPVLVSGQFRANLSMLRAPGTPFSMEELRRIRRLTDVIALSWATEQARRERELRVRLAERQQIADDLHDDVSQLLFGAELSLQAVIDHLDSDGHSAIDAARRARDLLVRGEVVLRESMRSLSSPKAGQFIDAFEGCVRGVEEEFGATVRTQISIDDSDQSTMSAALVGIVVRAVREGLINAVKHGGGEHITVTALSDEGELAVSVHNEGNQNSRAMNGGHGLGALRRMLLEFGGSVSLTREGLATVFTVSVPLFNG